MEVPQAGDDPRSFGNLWIHGCPDSPDHPFHWSVSYRRIPLIGWSFDWDGHLARHTFDEGGPGLSVQKSPPNKSAGINNPGVWVSSSLSAFFLFEVLCRN